MRIFVLLLYLNLASWIFLESSDCALVMKFQLLVPSRGGSDLVLENAFQRVRVPRFHTPGATREVGIS